MSPANEHPEASGDEHDEHADEEPGETQEPGVRLVDVNALRGDDAESSCLRPLNMCDLGSCDVCWYNPNHPRFKKI